jgi:hypothetical protein
VFQTQDAFCPFVFISSSLMTCFIFYAIIKGSFIKTFMGSTRAYNVYLLYISILPVGKVFIEFIGWLLPCSALVIFESVSVGLMNVCEKRKMEGT